jgi:hypothetical protein
MLKHYVRFFYPGVFVSESAEKPIESRESPIVLPDRAYAYQLLDREEIDQDGKLLRGSWENIGPTVYLGEVLTLDEVKRREPDKSILICNMETNGYPRVVRTRFGQYFPLGETDEVKSA